MNKLAQFISMLFFKDIQKLYSTESEVISFANEAIGLLGSKSSMDWLKKYGWNHPTVRSAILEHFMKVEAGERTTKVVPASREGIA